jgi:RNA polymerase sigma-70 factor (ECF subfamily)
VRSLSTEQEGPKASLEGYVSGIARHGAGQMRREADKLQQQAAGQGRFRRRRAMDDSPEARTVVLTAVERAQDGDEDALRLLYLRFADNIYSYVCSIVHDEHDAEDVTQGLFARLPTALKRYQAQSVPFQSWILRVAHNAAIDHVRSRRTVPVEEVRNPDAAAEDVGRDRLEALRTALRTMPTEQREVVVLRFVGGMTPGEIAQRLGRTENAVHALQHRGRRRLRTELERLEAAPLAMAA